MDNWNSLGNIFAPLGGLGGLQGIGPQNLENQQQMMRNAQNVGMSAWWLQAMADQAMAPNKLQKAKVYAAEARSRKVAATITGFEVT